MIINHNLTALSALNTARTTESMLHKSIQPLATGLRINSAADDASGIAISEKMRSQIAGYSMAVKNAQDGISLLQTAEGALGDSNELLQRMRELSVQSANDTLTSRERQHIDEEVQAIKGKLDMVSEITQFNTKKLLDGTSGLMWSASDDTLRATVRGGASILGKPEGSYRIEVRAEPGKAQVQRSNIFEVGKLTKIEQEDSGEESFQVFAESLNTLRDIEQFYSDTDGDAFIVEEPQTLKLVQGNGRTADLTLYGNDTLYDVADKINAAVSESLGQMAYVDDSGKFGTISDLEAVAEDDGESYSLKASLVLRSAVPGRNGELFLSGDDNLISALGLNTVQEATESTYSVSVYDADSGAALARAMSFTELSAKTSAWSLTLWPGLRLTGTARPNSTH